MSRTHAISSTQVPSPRLDLCRTSARVCAPAAVCTGHPSIWTGGSAAAAAALILTTGLAWAAPGWALDPPADETPMEAPSDAPLADMAGETAPAPAAPARSQLADPVASPLLDRHYRGGDPRHWTKVFERPGREVFDQRFRIVHAARPHPGMRVADIGAGTGLFTVLFARAVGPEGRVYAVDLSESFVAGIRELARTYRVDNIVPIVNTQKASGLEAGSIDLAFLNDTYRDFEQPRAMLDSIYQALVPYGTLIVVDLRQEPGVSATWGTRRMRGGRDRVVSEVEDAGFRLVEEPDFLRESYFLRFEKVGDEPDLEVGPIETDVPASEP